ncbi:golvesin C-terminal-like domain-containing protein [Streptomyces termitum]
MPLKRRRRAPLAVLASGVMLTGLIQATAWARQPGPEPSPSPAVAAAGTPMEKTDVPVAARSDLLGTDWNTSRDVAWTTTGDAGGFHLLTARRQDGYRWRTTATLSEAGFDADSWIGNACVTASGRRAVVVYAPRTFTNDEQLMARGGFTAVVDLPTGKVTKLDLQASLSYYNPGCGQGEQAVLTQSGSEDRPGTRLVTIDTESGKPGAPIVTTSQVTSAVPAGGGEVIGADGARLVSIDPEGRSRTLARTDGVPYRISVDSTGGVTLLDKTPHRPMTRVKRLNDAAAIRTGRPQRPVVLAEGDRTAVGLTTGDGKVFITGTAKTLGPLPTAVRHLTGVPKDTVVSTDGRAALTSVHWADGQDSRLPAATAGTGRTRPVDIAMAVLDTGRKTAFTVDPARQAGPRAAEGAALSPRLAARRSRKPATSGAPPLRTAPLTGPSALNAAGDPTNPVEEERTCSVPRNDPRNQALQPKPRQVEWAVDQAVTGNLNSKLSRPANWKNLGMPAYLPQSLFLNPPVDGGGRVPAQVLLGLTAQESNMWQASRVAVPGVTANPLIGNYYGIDLYDSTEANDWDVDWSEADCGYGITQVTDHMRMAGREDGHGGAAWPYDKQRAVALDYATNVSAGLQILVGKWNETRAEGLTLNDGVPSRLENWYYALWAYNSGFHPRSEAPANSGAWGLGWFNNPANPEWDAGRLPFMENAAGNDDASAAARPQLWPYQEKVLGFAAHPPAYLESPGTMVAAFRAAWWNGPDGAATVTGSNKYNRARVKPPEELFCDASNDCDPGRISDGADNSGSTTGPCGRADSRCWWNKPAVWKPDCSFTCGNEFMRFDGTYAEEPDGTAYPPACGNTGLPSNAIVVDDVPTDVPSIRPNCPKYWDSNGSFTLTFSNDGTEAVYPSKADTHQLGAGFGGHFYFAHTRPDDAKGRRLKVTGTWRAGSSVRGQAKVMVHLPDHGAQTKNARYEIDTQLGTVTRVLSQPGTGNRWVSLGAYRFDGAAVVRLSTLTPDGNGSEDVAFDAVAFVPGVYDGMPDITLPEPDLSGPEDLDVPDVPETFGKTLTAGLRSAAASPDTAPSCTDVPGEPGTRTCLSIEPAPPKKAPKAPARTAPGLLATGDTEQLVCSTSLLSRSYTRFDACISETLSMTKLVNDVPVGRVVFDLRKTIQLKVNSPTFTQKWTFTPVSFTGEVAQVSPNVQFFCGTGCRMSGPTWSGVPLWTVLQRHSATATATGTWTVPATPSSDSFGLNWTISGEMDGGATTTSDVFEPVLRVRCDNMFAGKLPGCVFPNFRPSFTVNTKRSPAAAAYYWLIQQKLAGHPGSRQHNKPLHRLGDTAAQDANRNILCKLAVAKWVPHSLTPNASCDEYPFAASRESGGQTIQSGSECVQLYTAKDTAGQWKLFYDERYPVPTWNEACGRASVPLTQNTFEGGALGRWTPKVRLFDNDAYFVETPGFAACDPNTFCQVRPD